MHLLIAGLSIALVGAISGVPFQSACRGVAVITTAATYDDWSEVSFDLEFDAVGQICVPVQPKEQLAYENTDQWPLVLVDSRVQVDSVYRVSEPIPVVTWGPEEPRLKWIAVSPAKVATPVARGVYLHPAISVPPGTYRIVLRYLPGECQDATATEFCTATSGSFLLNEEISIGIMDPI